MAIKSKPAAERSRVHSGLARSIPPIRVLTAVPICDGHDSPIITINLELVRHGMEVIYVGYHRSAQDIVRAAVQEDVQAVGISSYNGGHVEFFSEVLALLRRENAQHIGVFGGGGGTITLADASIMKRRGVDEIFFAGTSLEHIIEFVKNTYGRPGATHSARLVSFSRGSISHRALSQAITAAANGLVGRASGLSHGPLARAHQPPARLRTSRVACPVIGITGPGGAGKTTLIDELALRFLISWPKGRLAILSHDPSLPGKGALLGDRAAMVYAHHDRVFMRSLATRGHSGGLSSATRACLDILKYSGFDLMLVESAGIGQEDLPFAKGLVQRQVLVMSPEYGSRLQLQKIVMLEVADTVVLNKADYPGARRAASEIEQRLSMNGKGQNLIRAVAKQHRDPGVDQLFKGLLP